jgi:hypothetical protein
MPEMPRSVTQRLVRHGADRRRLCVGLTLALPAAALTSGTARTHRVGEGERFKTLQDALKAARSGDVIEVRPADYRGESAVLEFPRLTIRGLGRGVVFHADGQHAEGKAILVVRGDLVLENLEFRGARVPSGNGAGIRFESGHLAVRRCRFFDNEMGILTANEADMQLEVVDCEFGAAPHHEGVLHHLLYVGRIGAFSVSGSRFSQGWRGHLLKSRAQHNRVLYNYLVDGPAGEASYELEFPEGGRNVVVGNVIAQSATSQNPDLLSMGAEARGSGSHSLVLAHNTFVNLGDTSARFLHLWQERLAGDVQVQAINNLLAGTGQWPVGAVEDGGGNRRVDLGELRDPIGGDFHVRSDSALIGAAVPSSRPYTPTVEFVLPAGTRLIAAGTKLTPGAFSSVD